MTKIKKKNVKYFSSNTSDLNGRANWFYWMSSEQQTNGAIPQKLLQKLPEPSPTLPALKHKNPFIQLNQMQLVGTSCVVAQLKNKYPDVPMMF